MKMARLASRRRAGLAGPVFAARWTRRVAAIEHIRRSARRLDLGQGRAQIDAIDMDADVLGARA